MSRAIHLRSWIALSLTLVVAGCSSEKPTPAPEAKAAAAGETPSAYDPSQIPETADAAILAVVEGLRQKHPEALWHFLPPGYQNDVNGIVRTFAERMDPEVWSATMAVLQKTSRVLRDQKELLPAAIAGPGQAGPGPGPAPTDWEGLANLLETLVTSDLGDLSRLKKADVGQFLAVTGSRLLDQLQQFSKAGARDPLTLQLDELSNLRVKLVSSEGDTATVLIEPPGAEPRETDFVRIEGRWIPRDLADAWIENIGQAQARLSLLSPENLATQKPQILGALQMVDVALDKCAAARDQQQLAAALQGLALPGLMVAGLFQGAPADPANEPRESTADAAPLRASDLVTIVVRGHLDPAQQDELIERFRTAIGSNDQAFAEFSGDDELTSFKLGPVQDVEAFAKTIDFVEIVEIDVAGRTISARPKSK